MSTSDDRRSTTAASAPVEGAGPGTATVEHEVLLDVRGVKVHFPIKKGLVFDRTVGHVYAVDGMDLQIRRGETYGLVGESGCGKSTFGRAILRLEDLTEGQVLFDGTDLASLDGEPLRRQRRHMQMVFQDPLGSLDPRQTVEQLLLETFKGGGFDKRTVPMYARMLVGAVALVGEWWLDAGKPSREQVAAHVVNLMWNGLRGLDAKPTLRTVVGG